MGHNGIAVANDVIAGRYRLREPLGSGPMSEVWAADDRELGRRVALKLLAPDADRARFEREARAAAALAHPNITQLYDYAEGRAKIADFGIARLGQGGTLTEAGTLLGTAAYISPEQAGGQPASPASDV